MMFPPPPLTPDPARKYYRPETKPNKRWRGSQVRVKRQKLPRDECRHDSNCFACTVVDLQVLDVLQTGVQAAPSVSGNLKTENAETIYIQRTMHLDPLKKNPLVSTPTVFFPFYSCAIPAPAPYLRPRHTRAIPAPARSITSPYSHCACPVVWPGSRLGTERNQLMATDFIV